MVQDFVLSDAPARRKEALAKFLDFQEWTSGLVRFDLTLEAFSKLLGVDQSHRGFLYKKQESPSLEPLDMSKGKWQDWKVS